MPGQYTAADLAPDTAPSQTGKFSAADLAPSADETPNANLVGPILMARHDGVPDDETLDYLTKFKPELQGQIDAQKKSGKTSAEILDGYAGKQDKPGPVGSYFKSLVGDTASGLLGTVKRLNTPVTAETPLDDKIAAGVAGPIGPLINDAIKSHIATGRKAVAAWRDPNTSPLEAAGYTGAALLPVVGPAAAALGEKGGAAVTPEGNVDWNKVAETAGGATAMVAGTPIARGAGRMVGKLAPGLAENAQSLYRSALKPSTAIAPTEADSLVNFGLENGIPVSKGGLAKLSKLISDHANEVNQRIMQGTAAGATVDPVAAADRGIAPVRSRFANQLDNAADLSAIDATKQRFLEQHSTPAQSGTTLYGANGQPMQVGAQPARPIPIPADEALSKVRGTYQKLKGQYGELKGSEIEAQKGLARGIKEELQAQFPELKALTEKQWKALQLEPELERAINRHANAEPVGILPTMAMHASGHPLIAGVLAKLVSNPAVRARLAMGLNTARQMSMLPAGRALVPAASAGSSIRAKAKIAAYVKALQEAAAQPVTGVP